MNNIDLIYLRNQYLLSKCSIYNQKNNLIKRIIISGTHNNRLECFFSKTFKKSKHFSNCAIVRCCNKNNKISFTLIYSGDHNDSSYWLLEEFNNIANKDYDLNYNLPEDTEIFLVRHGKGVHNRDALLDKIYYGNIRDPSLDNIGVNQAIAAGNFLNSYISSSYSNPKIFFTASHLIRTQQTVGLIMKQMNINEKIYIAPCTHELIYMPNIDCDCSLIQSVPIGSNIPNCDINNMCPLLTKYCHTDCYNTNSIPLNWDYYKLFYNTNEKCCNNNMLNQIIRTILRVEYPN